VLSSKVSLGPLDKSFDFQPTSLFWNLSTTGSQIALLLKDAPRGRLR